MCNKLFKFFHFNGFHVISELESTQTRNRKLFNATNILATFLIQELHKMGFICLKYIFFSLVKLWHFLTKNYWAAQLSLIWKTHISRFHLFIFVVYANHMDNWRRIKKVCMTCACADEKTLSSYKQIIYLLLAASYIL